MSLTKALNSKSNVKQLSNADLPVIPRQPVLAKYGPVESTASQTIINFPFQIDTLNNPDSLVLTIDGKTMSPGAAYDFQYSSVDAFGFSSQVTLTQSLPAALNIQAWKLGLKKETEFAQDARFTNLYESQDQGFQGFVKTSDLMVATATAGTPASGLFYSSISNRASMPDLRTDLKARMGIERVTTQNIYQLQNEFGPNGEPVWAIVNDGNGLIRCVGTWSSFNGSVGQGMYPNFTTDYAEVTFYGTGLNIVMGNNSSTIDLRYSVDGGAESVFFSTTLSAVLNGRNYSQNSPMPVVSGLALGVHTVKIRNNVNPTNVGIDGFEILNESSSLKINPGASYMVGKKATTLAQQSLAYNSSFESGTLGTRGGRVVVYQKADGTIAKAVQPTDAAQANLTSANHQNEELARTYFPREFGAGRADDFSSLLDVSSNRAFTLDDGTTTLIAQGARIGGLNNQSVFSNTTNDFITITFVGTGLDVLCNQSGGAIDSVTVTIDGTSAGSLTGITANTHLRKIVSGLPYGTHVVRFLRSAAVSGALGFINFIVYQPKKPTIPSGAIELADYNVMASFVANTVASTETMSTGVLRKNLKREATFVNGTGGTTGGWIFNPAGLTGTDRMSLQGFLNDQLNAYLEYTFFGTGFDLRNIIYSSTSNNIQVQLQSLSTGGALLNATLANFPTMSNSTYGTGTGFVNTTGILDFKDPSTISGAGFVTSNLPLGLWKVRFQNLNSGSSNYMEFDCLDIITPIHSPKSNQYADLQNTLPVGSNAISDNRKTTPIKDISLQPKAWAQAQGVTSGPTTTLTSYVPMPDMSCTIKVGSTNGIKISYSSGLSGSVVNQAYFVQVYVNGVAVGTERLFNCNVNGNFVTLSDSFILPVAPGVYKVDLYWSALGGGTMTAYSTRRNLTVEER